MNTLLRDQAIELYEQWWNEMKEEWFKIEVLQGYSGEDMGPSLEAWLEGNKEKSIQYMSGEMKEWIEICTKSPANKTRLRIVQEPLTPYTEWELELYKQVNIPLCGEQVYVIPYEKVQHLTIPDGDVTIFDQTRAVRAHYIDGKVEKMGFYEEDTAEFLSLRDNLKTYATQLLSI